MPAKTKKRFPVTKNTIKGKTARKGNKGGLSNIAAPATGAVIGAAIGGIAGAALTNNKTRKVVGNIVENASDYAQKAIDAAKENQNTLKDRTTDLAIDTLKKTKKKLRN